MSASQLLSVTYGVLSGKASYREKTGKENSVELWTKSVEVDEGGHEYVNSQHDIVGE